ncbi:unnamed protein product, partial [Polarella glacialis]
DTRYFFFALFLVEMVMKLYALRSNYWQDRWNTFDFFCVVASSLGYFLTAVSNMNFSAITSLFRVARLFRLLRYMKGVKKIFSALATSVPKLINVLLILLLLLILYSILGVSLFSTSGYGKSLNVNANFKDFASAFITLFRASTGEAWNQIMYDLAVSPQEVFGAGSFCSPDYLFNPETTFDVLNDKCLIETPNSCNPGIFPRTMVIAYWVSYTLVVSIMVMNLVIAVILESYEDSQGGQEQEIIDMCIQVWRKYDPDHKLSLEMHTLMRFIAEVLPLVLAQDTTTLITKSVAMATPFATRNIATIPMKFVRALNMPLDDNNEVAFILAVKQVLTLVSVSSNPELIKELLEVEEKMDKKLTAKFRAKMKHNHSFQAAPELQKASSAADIIAHIAAMKLQKGWRKRRKSQENRSF